MMHCIVTGKGTSALGRAVRPCDTVREGLRYGRDRPRHSRPHAGACGSARDLAGGVCHDTIVCIMTGGRPGCWGLCCDTNGCVVIGGRPGCWVCYETGHDTALRYGQAGARYGAMIPPGDVQHDRGACDTARSSALNGAATQSARHSGRYGWVCAAI